MKIAVTGYCGSGSSAIIGLLEEYGNCTTGRGCKEGANYEHVPFYTPNGLFDLEYKLLYNNNLHRSDEAINSFLCEMNRLNRGTWGWFGNYHTMFGDEFQTIVKRFTDRLIQYRFPGYWSYDHVDQKLTLKGCIKDAYLVGLKRRHLNHPFGVRTIYKEDNEILASFVDPDTFFSAAREFVDSYINLFADNDKNLIFDHLLLPQNAHRIGDYFPDDFRLIIVDRDIRDMYALTKFVWLSMGMGAPYPKNIEDFCTFWRRFRSMEKEQNDPRILRVYFEDLVYRYEETVAEIENFLQLDPDDHTKKYQHFDPARSINNTQNFRMEQIDPSEIETLKKKFSQYLYPFPNVRIPEYKDLFNA